ncbi:MAG: SpoIID/LytB domain-containing protein [Elusimicrobiota bacterium]|nr:SpoIID/LytB domain-containing protein [Elusimicrobiota bacterium]
MISFKRVFSKPNIALLFFVATFIFMAGQTRASDSTAYKFYLRGDLTKSANEYLFKSRLNPKDTKPLLNAAIVYKQLGKYKNSIKAFNKALIIEPENSDILCELGWVKFHLTQYNEAAKLFEKSLKNSPNHTRSLLGLGSVYSHLNKKVDSLNYLKKYKELRPDFSGIDYIIAWDYVNFKMYEKAEKYLIEALRKDPSFIEARLPLAGIYARGRKFNKAWNQYQRVLDYAPKHPTASKMIKVLDGKITKQPEEIRPPFKIKGPPKLAPIDALKELDKSTRVRVGIGTKNTGRQGINKVLKFKSFEGFKVIGKRSGRLYATAKPNEIWTAMYRNGRVVLKDPKNKIYGRFKGPILIKPYNPKKGYIIFENIKNSRNPWFRYSDRAYRGIIELYPIRRRGIGIVNIIDMEIYLLGVVPSEVLSWWPYETLKTQAIIARTQVLIRKARGGKHKKWGYHLCDSQHCQVYKGVNIERNSTNNAVVDTQGRILTYRGRPAQTFYHSNCGGHIQASKEVSGWGNIGYLKTHQDLPKEQQKTINSPWDFHQWIMSNPPSYCNTPGITSSAHFRWIRIIKHKDLNHRINQRYNIGTLKKIFPLKRSHSGNVNGLRVVGSKKTIDITREHLIRNVMGFGSVKSTLFFMETNRFKDGRIRNYWIYGGGWGHGIGLCQSGAAGMAAKYKKTAREILEFYFPGTKLSKIKYIRKKRRGKKK